MVARTWNELSLTELRELRKVLFENMFIELKSDSLKRLDERILFLAKMYANQINKTQ